MAQFRRKFLIERAKYRCEYCHFHERNLSLGPHCSGTKGPNIASVDWITGTLVRLLNPRTDNWANHFQIVGDEITGLTPIGRATSNLLDMNNPNHVKARAALRKRGKPVGSE
jgi:hypothetical protein